jgi:hypothetical protein
MHLSGTQRIVVVLVVIWIPIGFLWGNLLGIQKGDWAIESRDICLDAAAQRYSQSALDSKAWDAANADCWARFQHQYDISIRGHEGEGALMVVGGLLFLVLAWLLLWIAWRVFHWVYEGFAPR